MSRPLIFRPVARKEFDDATDWYESRSSGLGDRFVAAVDATVAEIASNPFRFAVAFADVREAPVSKFPYCVYYRIRPHRLAIVAVFHSSRDPDVLSSRR